MPISQFFCEVLSVLCGFKDKRMSMTTDVSMSVLRSLTCQFEFGQKALHRHVCIDLLFYIFWWHLLLYLLGDFRFLQASQMKLYRKLAMSYNTAPFFVRLKQMTI